jgi:hypothetical protein
MMRVRSKRPVRLLVLLGAVVAVTASACASSTPATVPGDATGVGTRTLVLDLSGPSDYERTVTVTGGSVRVAYANNNAVDTISGTVTFPSSVSGTASATFALRQELGAFNGTVAVADAAAGVDATVGHNLVAVGVDGDGDASATASAGGLTLAWSITTVPAPGLEPVLDDLTAEEDTFCQDAQQRLTGLDESELPVASVGNVLHTSRGVFGGSKASLSPLQVQTWSEADMATTANGNTVALTHRISCKTRSADHLATTGLATSPDLQCRELNQRSLDLAVDRLSPAELAAYQLSGRPVSLQSDVVEQTGVGWLTAIADEVATPTALNLSAHALLVNWNDPAFAVFPDSIRGVHYCTVWSPAWAYWYLTVGAFEA